MPPVSRSVKVAAAGGVAAVAAGIGASQALAASSTPSPSATSSTAPRGTGERGPGHGRGGPGRGVDTAALAKALGMSEDTVTSALASVRDATRPSSPPAEGSKPSEADRQAREKARVTALAKALGVSESKLQAALDSIEAEHRANRRADLATRLDAAVGDGTLTAADKASVLKAYDAGVLGGAGPR